MNLTYMKYAVEVAECGGINKAAEKLLIAQSNLSRSIKELENEIGITIFERSPKGVTLTPEGDEFIRHSRSLLSQMNDLENIYKKRSDKSVSFSVSVPRASYVSEAFLELNEHLADRQTKLYFKQSNAVRTIESVLDCSCRFTATDTYFIDAVKRKAEECGMTVR